MAGAGLGGLARYALGTWIMTKSGVRFPLGTLVVNASGSFLIGLLMSCSPSVFSRTPTGGCFWWSGCRGYTTFSSFEYETLQAVRSGERWMGFLYAAGSVVFGYLAAWLGVTRPRNVS
jgi:CrcB protein